MAEIKSIQPNIEISPKPVERTEKPQEKPPVNQALPQDDRVNIRTDNRENGGEKVEKDRTIIERRPQNVSNARPAQKKEIQVTQSKTTQNAQNNEAQKLEANQRTQTQQEEKQNVSETEHRRNPVIVQTQRGQNINKLI